MLRTLRRWLAVAAAGTMLAPAWSQEILLDETTDLNAAFAGFALGDLDHDDKAEIAIGRSAELTVYSGCPLVAQYSVTLPGVNTQGTGVATLNDLNGDSVRDLAVTGVANLSYMTALVSGADGGLLSEVFPTGQSVQKCGRCEC